MSTASPLRRNLGLTPQQRLEQLQALAPLAMSCARPEGEARSVTDFGALIRALSESGAQFVIVGGVAATLSGIGASYAGCRRSLCPQHRKFGNPVRKRSVASEGKRDFSPPRKSAEGVGYALKTWNKSYRQNKGACP